MLEYHAHLLAQAIHVNAGLVDLRAFKPNFAAGRRFQKVQAAQEGTFTRAGGADHDDFFSLLDLLIDTFEDMQSPSSVWKVFSRSLTLITSCQPPFQTLENGRQTNNQYQINGSHHEERSIYATYVMLRMISPPLVKSWMPT